MTLAQSLTAIIIFWAIIGGLGASLLLPAMQSLIHGNFEGAAQKQAYALVGAAAAIAAAVGPLLGGFITTYLSWRVGVRARGRDHRDRAVRHQAGARRALHRRRGRSTWSARSCRSSAWAASCSGILVWQEGGEAVGALLVARARSRWRLLVWWLRAAQARGQADAARPGPVRVRTVPARRLRADAAADRARRRDDRAADLPPDGARVQRDGGRPVARAAVADACSRWRCWPAGEPGAAPGQRHHPGRLRAAHGRAGGADPDRAAGRRRAGTSWSR